MNREKLHIRQVKPKVDYPLIYDFIHLSCCFNNFKFFGIMNTMDMYCF